MWLRVLKPQLLLRLQLDALCLGAKHSSAWGVYGPGVHTRCEQLVLAYC